MPGTVVDRLRERSSAFPDAIAVVDGDVSLTHRELFERADRLAAALHAEGLRPGDAILAFLENQHEAIECELAALSSGLAWVTLTARLTWAEVRGVMAACSPRLVVTTPEGRKKLAEGNAAMPLPDFPWIVVTGAEFESLLASGAGKAPPRADVGPETPARLRYTSGTTGTAKAAVLPHRVYHASLDALLELLAPTSPADRALHVAPLTHGSGALVHPVLHAGGTNVLLRHFDVEGVLSAVEQHRITTFFTVPTILSRLVSSADWSRHDLSSLRALVYGGAPMPAAQLDAAVRKIGRALVQIYGMTEAPWPIASLRQADHVSGSPRLRSVGRPTPNVEVRVVNDRGEPLGPDEVGELVLRGPNVMSGYLDDDEGTRAVFREGWLHTGDVGRIDPDGYVFIVGRRKDVVISGGFNVYAAEVESALSTDPRVLEAAVVGLPHDDWGELVAAVVVPRPGAVLRAEDVDAVARRLLSGYKCPRRIEIAADLPKNASGKIQKSELVKRLR
ncbi:MAG TPA: AMP-binding protein [Polyangiaceae bacterium]|nr:AMP-binding protein [Polyangiaceae bacterium]